MVSRALVSAVSLVVFTGCSARPDAARSEGASSTTSTPGATIHFGQSGEPTLEGTPTAGGSLKVDYDWHRLLDDHPECVDRSGYEHTRVGVVQLGFKFNDDASRVYYYVSVSGFSASDLSTPYRRDEIPLAGDVHKVALWFSCGPNGRHDVAYDNRGGANYEVDVAAAPRGDEVLRRTVRTIKGNTFDVKLEIGPQQEGPDAMSGGRYWSTYTVTVTYDKVKQYSFGGSDAEAWIGWKTYVAHHGGGNDPAKTTGKLVPLELVTTGSPEDALRYTGTVSFDLGGWLSDTQENLVELEFAFHDQGTHVAADAWDSNGGQNYKVKLF